MGYAKTFRLGKFFCNSPKLENRSFGSLQTHGGRNTLSLLLEMTAALQDDDKLKGTASSLFAKVKFEKN